MTKNPLINNRNTTFNRNINKILLFLNPPANDFDSFVTRKSVYDLLLTASIDEF